MTAEPSAIAETASTAPEPNGGTAQSSYRSHRRRHHKRSSSGTVLAAASPAPSGSNAPFPCDDNQFLADQNNFANGAISTDQLVDVCGPVTQVLPAKTTRSGAHGYFYVKMPSGYQIEIVSNLNAMANAPTNQPPPWPWVAVNDYVYVQGRYYYDNASSQGIDWTEDDTGRSWPNVGYVAVCNSGGANCTKYW